jgi:hypothetical protein
MTPGLNWCERYARRPALAKLEYCDRVMTELREREPLTTAEDLDEDVGSLDSTLDEHYRAYALDKIDVPADLEDALQAIFGEPDNEPSTTPRRAAMLIRRLERTISANVYRWTGWFPERARHTLRELSELAEKRNLTYAEDREIAATVALTTFITALAMSQLNDASA